MATKNTNAGGDAKIPVTILTGFLGAGKTTLLNHILTSKSHGMKFAVIENELGDVGVDEDVVVKQGSEEQVIEVMNGCICCTVRGDLVNVLKRLKERLVDNKFDGVIIETTGLANPAPVAQTFFIDEDVQEHFFLDGIITVVDAKHVMMHLMEKKEEGATNESVEQVAFADRILLNKTDLVPEEAKLAEIERELRSINSSAQIIRTAHSKVDPKHLVNINVFDLDKVLEMDPEFLKKDGEEEEDGHAHGHGHGHGHSHACDSTCDHGSHGEGGGGHTTNTRHERSIGSVSVKFEGELNVNALQHFIQDLIQTRNEDLFRYKGVLAVKGMKPKFVFQGVHMVFTGGFSETHNWRDDEKRICKFCFIGRNLDKAALTDGFMKCKVGAALRFSVGTLIQANVGEWTDGKIIKQWDEGNPYRIELADEDHTNVWGPVDADDFVRARPAAAASSANE